ELPELKTQQSDAVAVESPKSLPSPLTDERFDRMEKAIDFVVEQLPGYLKEQGNDAVSIGQFHGPANLPREYVLRLRERLMENGLRIVDPLESVVHLRGDLQQDTSGTLRIGAVRTYLIDPHGQEIGQFRDRFLIGPPRADMRTNALPDAPASPAPMPPSKSSHESLLAAIDELAVRTMSFLDADNEQTTSVGPIQAEVEDDARRVEQQLINALRRSGVTVVDKGESRWNLRGTLLIDMTGESPVATVDASIVRDEN
ncbi:MAG: hypothetical protein ACF8PG_05990, partial [Maioricimonas sp. JB045]